jgi:hypothetical protein
MKTKLPSLLLTGLIVGALATSVFKPAPSWSQSRNSQNLGPVNTCNDPSVSQSTVAVSISDLEELKRFISAHRYSGRFCRLNGSTVWQATMTSHQSAEEMDREFSEGGFLSQLRRRESQIIRVRGR